MLIIVSNYFQEISLRAQREVEEHKKYLESVMQQQVADIERDLQQQMAEETAEHAAKIVSTHVSLQVISLCQPTPAKEPSPLPELPICAHFFFASAAALRLVLGSSRPGKGFESCSRHSGQTVPAVS